VSTTSDVALELEWHQLHARYAVVSGALDRALAEYGLGVSDFEVLDRLVSSGTKLRVQELASSVHLSQSALSRVVARLERDGLVERAICVDDRRGIFVRLTDDGRARHVEAAPTRQQVLTEHLSEPSRESHEGCVGLT
jgi:DNA-binding MarR family transcriptional regulator